jgi:hypothetical protein
MATRFGYLTWRKQPALLTSLGVVLAVSTVVAWKGRPERPPHVLPNIPVSAERLSAMPAHNSPVLAVDPTNPNFVAIANRLDNPDFDCALHLSGDGGRVWVNAGEVIALPTGAEKCYAPEVAFDAIGALHYLFVGLHGPGNRPMGAFIVSSEDRAKTFSVPRQVLGPGNYQVRMALDKTIGDRGRIYLVWLEVHSDAPLGGFPPPPNPLMASYSDDGGKTFSQPVQVSDSHRNYIVAPAIAVSPGRGLHVAYMDLERDQRDYQGLDGPTWEGTWSLVMSNSLDGGRSFSLGSVVNDGIVPYERLLLIYTMPPPAVAVDDSGNVYVAWDDARRGDPDVWMSRSSDRGTSWRAAMRLNDDKVANGRHQYMPRLSLSHAGRLDVIFYDRRGDRENILTDLFYTFSSDHGRTFSTNLKVTNQSSDSRIGTSYPLSFSLGRPEHGSRVALLSFDDRAVAAWMDTRNSYLGTAAQSLFSTEVRFRRRNSLLFMASLSSGMALTAAGWFGRRTRVKARCVTDQ